MLTLPMPDCAPSIRRLARVDARRDLAASIVDAYGAFERRQILADVHRLDYACAYVLEQLNSFARKTTADGKAA